MDDLLLFHYTDGDGYKAISSQVEWMFKASQPPGNHECGAYFTTLRPDARRFSARTRIPREKQQFVFAFTGNEGLLPVDGGKGKYIFWTPTDYLVVKPRQVYHGLSKDLP